MVDLKRNCFLAVLQMQEFSYLKSYVFVLLHFVPILAL